MYARHRSPFCLQPPWKECTCNSPHITSAHTDRQTGRQADRQTDTPTPPHAHTPVCTPHAHVHGCAQAHKTNIHMDDTSPSQGRNERVQVHGHDRRANDVERHAASLLPCTSTPLQQPNECTLLLRRKAHAWGDEAPGINWQSRVRLFLNRQGCPSVGPCPAMPAFTCLVYACFPGVSPVSVVASPWRSSHRCWLLCGVCC
jgi:hypothetical protein